jgi:hypothetical protein
MQYRPAPSRRFWRLACEAGGHRTPVSYGSGFVRRAGVAILAAMLAATFSPLVSPAEGAPKCNPKPGGLSCGAITATPKLRPSINLSAWISIASLPDDTLEVRDAHGNLKLPPEIAPPSQRAWRLVTEGPDRPLIIGRVLSGNEIAVEVLTLNFVPRQEAAGRNLWASPPNVAGEALAVLVVNRLHDPGAPCSKGRGCLGTAEATLDGQRLESFDTFLKLLTPRPRPG